MVTVLVEDTLLRVIEPVTGQIHAEHTLVAPGEVSIDDAHYDKPRPDKPNRTARPRTQQEKDFLALGPIAEAFLTGAAAAGVTKLPSVSVPVERLVRRRGASAYSAFGRLRAAARALSVVAAARVGFLREALPVPQISWL